MILHVSKARQLPKGANVCEAIDQDAFRCDGDGISVTWVEYFEGEQDPFRQAAFALKGDLQLKKSGILAAAKVRDIRNILSQVGLAGDVETDPQPTNNAHCLIKGITQDNLSALLALTRAFPSERFAPCSQIQGLV